MIVIFAALAGALTGGIRASRRKGNLLDILQYGAVYAIIFALVGLLATIIIHRLVLAP